MFNTQDNVKQNFKFVKSTPQQVIFYFFYHLAVIWKTGKPRSLVSLSQPLNNSRHLNKRNLSNP